MAFSATCSHGQNSTLLNEFPGEDLAEFCDFGYVDSDAYLEVPSPRTSQIFPSSIGHFLGVPTPIRQMPSDGVK
jgi:hypothetical protein